MVSKNLSQQKKGAKSGRRTSLPAYLYAKEVRENGRSPLLKHQSNRFLQLVCSCMYEVETAD